MAESLFKNIRVWWLAFIVYWGIVLFGYDTCVLLLLPALLLELCWATINLTTFR